MARNGLRADSIDTADYALRHPLFGAAELKARRLQMMKELAPPQVSRWQHSLNAARLLRKDPAFFWRKVRYKLGR